MQTALRLVAPYGTAFQTTMSPMPGAPMEVWLMHDTTKAGDVIEWLRNTIMEYENQLQQLAKAQVMAQQSAAQAQVVHNEQPATVGMAPAQRLPDPAIGIAPPAPPTARRAHDWGGSYKLGKPCVKCGVTATGFEQACK
jgi:hypothetical protein